MPIIGVFRCPLEGGQESIKGWGFRFSSQVDQLANAGGVRAASGGAATLAPTLSPASYVVI